ncbi:MAG: BON domain-containing protein [Magnetovibrio sp.]|nr:BON domain-containing protein [Magnetovibrio sp.]
MSDARRRRPAILALVLFALAVPVLAGCAGAVVGAGAAVGVAAFEERSLKTIAADTKMATEVRLNLLEAGEEYTLKIGLKVFEGRALLTGAVPTEAMRAEAVKLTWKVAGIKDVINEVQISDAGFLDTARDAWITTQLKSKLAVDQEIHAINYSVETVNGIIYLIGIAQSQVELDRVIGHARNLGYVKKVISHVRVKKSAAKT